MPALTDTFTLANGLEIPKIGFGTWQIPDGAPAYDAVAAALRGRLPAHRHGAGLRQRGQRRPRGPRQRHPPRPDLRHHQAAGRGQGLRPGPGQLRTDRAGAGSGSGRPLPDPRTLAVDRDRPGLPRRQHRGLAGDGGALRRRAGAVDRRLQLHRRRHRVPPVRVDGHAAGQPDPLLRRPHPGRRDGLLHRAPDPGRGLLAARHRRDPGQPGGRCRSPSKYGRSVAQLCIRYLLEHDVLPLPKSTTPSRIVENADVDFAIAAEDLAAWTALVDTTDDPGTTDLYGAIVRLSPARAPCGPVRRRRRCPPAAPRR